MKNDSFAIIIVGAVWHIDGTNIFFPQSYFNHYKKKNHDIFWHIGNIELKCDYIKHSG